MNKKLLAVGALLTATVVATLGFAAPANASAGVTAPIQTSGSNNMVAVSADGKLVAAVSQDASAVTIYTVATAATRDISLSSGSYQFPQFSPDNKTLYVGDSDNNRILVLDLSTESTTEIDLTFAPLALVISPDGRNLYAEDNSESGTSVYKIDLTRNTVGNDVYLATGYYSWNMCISNDGASLYVPNYNRDEVYLIGTAAFTDVDATWPSQVEGAWGCAVDAKGNVFVDNYTPKVIEKFASDGTSTVSAAIGNYPYGVAVSCDTVYSIDSTTPATIFAFSSSDLTSLHDITVPEAPGGEGFFGYSAAQSADGSVIAVGGSTATDGLVIISSPECAPSLPDTGASQSLLITLASVGGGLVIIGIVAMIIVRRRRAQDKE